MWATWRRSQRPPSLCIGFTQARVHPAQTSSSAARRGPRGREENLLLVGGLLLGSWNVWKNMENEFDNKQPQKTGKQLGTCGRSIAAHFHFPELSQKIGREEVFPSVISTKQPFYSVNHQADYMIRGTISTTLWTQSSFQSYTIKLEYIYGGAWKMLFHKCLRGTLIYLFTGFILDWRITLTNDDFICFCSS